MLAKLTGLVTVVGLLGGCPEKKEPPPPVTAHSATKTPASASAGGTSMAKDDSKFHTFSANFLKEYARLEPVSGTEAGDHTNDGSYPDRSEIGEGRTRSFALAQLKALEAMPKASLSNQAQVDRAIIMNQLKYWLFAIDELKEVTWNPLVFIGMIGDGLDPILNRNYAPIPERAKSLRGRLEAIPKVLEVAKKRIVNPPEIHTKTAMLQAKGLVNLCEKGLDDFIKQSGGEQEALKKAAKAAAVALKDYSTYLEKELLPKSKGDFRIGRAKFEKKLRFVVDDHQLAIDDFAKEARELLKQTQGEMVVTAKELWPILFAEKGKDGKPGKAKTMPKLESEADKIAFVKKVLDKMAEDRPTNATIVKDAERLLKEATEFVKSKDLVKLPTEPCQVIEMPEYRRGVAVAYCDSSGPLEKKPETFFAIAPTPKDWSKKQADSFYKEYNYGMLMDLVVHEAMPGHFLQLMHNNKFPSKLRGVFSNGSFVEGWAVYTEWLMAHHGNGGPKTKLQRQKMVLRLACNAILDHEVHAGTMDKKAALELMMNEAFQEEGEALGKWKRAQLTSSQLSTYFYGFSQFMKMRKIAEKQKDFKERTYHDKVLSYGSPPMRHIRALMGMVDAPKKP
jgi:uncharacterized protein (DUF885 family)